MWNLVTCESIQSWCFIFETIIHLWPIYCIFAMWLTLFIRRHWNKPFQIFPGYLPGDVCIWVWIHLLGYLSAMLTNKHLLLLSCNFYGWDMSRMYFLIFASCELLTLLCYNFIEIKHGSYLQYTFSIKKALGLSDQSW